MKKILLTLAIALASYCSNAQTNIFPTSGNVGIGTTSPGYALDVIGDISNSRFFHNSGGAYWFLNGTNRTATIAAGGLAVTENYNDAAPTNGLYVQGNVGIGTTTPDAKLAVNGTIHTKEVKVDLAGWPDYVFKSAYVLPSLLEVKTYIQKNQHLSEMPSEQEVIKNGINLGEMVSYKLKRLRS